MILGVITAEGSGQSHAAIIARAMNIPGIVQVGKDFLDDCDGRTVILDATNGNCILDPDAAARQQAEASICQLQREDAEMKQLHSLPDETRDANPLSCWPTASARRISTPPCSPAPRALGCCAAAT